MRFVGPRHLQRAETAVGTCGNGVGIDRVRIGFDVGNSVRTKTTIAGLLRHPRARVGIGAGFHVDKTLPGNQFSILGHSALDPNPGWMAGYSLEALFNRVGKPNRSPGLESQRNRKRFRLHGELATVGTADVGHDDADLVERNPKDFSQMLAQGERLLRSRPKGNAISIHMGDGGMGLHGKVLDPGKAECVFEDVIGFLKPRLDISLGVAETIAKIGTREFLRRFVMLAHQFTAAGDTFVHQRGLGGQGFLYRSYSRQFFVLDVDRIQGCFCRSIVHRRDGRHRVTDITNLVHRNDGLILIRRAEHAEPALVISRNDGINSGEFFCFAAINAGEAGVGVGTTKNFPMCHSRQLDIHRIDGLAGNLLFTVQSGLRPTDNLVSLCLLHLLTSLP